MPMRSIHPNDRRLRHAMTVKDLIAIFEDCPADARVLFASDYGDISHTQQALPVSFVNELNPDREALEESAYSHSGMAVQEFDEDDWGDDEDEKQEEELDEEIPNVVILRMDDPERD